MRTVRFKARGSTPGEMAGTDNKWREGGVEMVGWWGVQWVGEWGVQWVGLCMYVCMYVQYVGA